MRTPYLLIAFLLMPGVASALDPVEDAYRVAGSFSVFGPVSGYLQVGRGLGELWLEGPSVASFHRMFSFLCTSAPASDLLVVEDCRGANNARFVAIYAADASGEASGPAFGQALLPDLELTVTSHT